MDYTDPADRRLRDEPTKPLSPDEAVIAANLYSAKVLANLMAALQGKSQLNLPNNNEKANPDSRHN